MTELHIYTDNTNWVIAYSEEDATKIFMEHVEYDEEDLGFIAWYKMNMRSTFTYYYDDAPGDNKPPGRRALKSNYSHGEWMVKATVKEWIELRGRGFFAGTEY